MSVDNAKYNLICTEIQRNLAAVRQKRLSHSALAAHDFGKTTCAMHFRNSDSGPQEMIGKYQCEKTTPEKVTVSLRIKEMSPKKRTSSSTPNSARRFELTIKKS